MKHETLDEKIAKALMNPDVTADHLDSLIDDAEKAVIRTKEAALAARERAVDPRVVDSNSLAIAIENESLQKRYANAREQLLKKRNQIEFTAAHASWTAQANAADAEAEAVAEEFTSTYASFVTAFLALAERVKNVNQTAHHLSTTRLNGSCSVKSLDVIAKILEGMKLPNPAQVDQFLWPLPYQPPMIGLMRPVYDDRLYSADWAAAKAEQEQAILKKKRDEAQQREEKAHATYGGPRWWAGEKLPPERAG